MTNDRDAADAGTAERTVARAATTTRRMRAKGYWDGRLEDRGRSPRHRPPIPKTGSQRRAYLCLLDALSREGVKEMFITSSGARRCVIPFLAVVAAMVVPASASAAVETFHRFEAVATANFVVTEQCPDGSTVTKRVTVIGGHEEESESGTTTRDSDFVTVLIRGLDCEGNFVNDRGSGSAEFTFSPSLQEASVAGTITTRDGRSVTVDVAWEGVGPIESTSNTTTFPGFTGHFQSKRRDAVASGTVVVDGQTLVDGSTTNAEIETLEDNNISTGA
jgi:hypothetical protein